MNQIEQTYPNPMQEYEQQAKFLLAVDCIIFGFDGQQLKALFVKRAFNPGLNNWSLMGGFVEANEGVNKAASRILERLTGLKNIYMEQLYCFDDLDRDPGGRVISIAYFALINIADYKHQLVRQHHAEWFDLNNIPQLVFDHNAMVMRAKEHLQQKMASHPIGFALLPQKFTLQELHNLYEAIGEIALDKRNFARRILKLGVLARLYEKDRGTSKKGSFYYVFDKDKYKKLEKEGIKFV